jgi:ArsR family transcriptional regulator
MTVDESVTKIFKALADPARLSILEFLWSPTAEEFRTAEGVCASDLTDFLGVTQPTVSHHMKVLVEAGLVTAEKRGKWVYYECVTEGFDGIVGYLERYRHPSTGPVVPTARERDDA